MPLLLARDPDYSHPIRPFHADYAPRAYQHHSLSSLSLHWANPGWRVALADLKVYAVHPGGSASGAPTPAGEGGHFRHCGRGTPDI